MRSLVELLQTQLSRYITASNNAKQTKNETGYTHENDKLNKRLKSEVQGKCATLLLSFHALRISSYALSPLSGKPP